MEKENERVKVDINMVLDIKEQIDYINSIDLYNIDFVGCMGDVVKVKKEELDEWKLLGLNNVDFICMNYDKLIGE